MKTNENKSIHSESESSNLEEIFTLSLVGVTQAEVYHAVERVEGLQRIIEEVKSIREKEEKRSLDIKKLHIAPFPEKTSSGAPPISIIEINHPKKSSTKRNSESLHPTENP